MHGRHIDAGFPAEVSFQGVLFNPAANAVVVRLCDRALEHPGARVYHRNVSEQVYHPTFSLRAEESVDALVVPLGAPFAFGLVRTWVDSPLGFAGGHRRVVRAPLDGKGKARALEWPGAEGSKVVDLLSVSDDATTLYCKVAVPVAGAGDERSVHHRIHRWNVDTGELTEVARLSRAFY